MKYLQGSFTLATNTAKIDDLTYQLRVGSITQAEYDKKIAERATTKQVDVV